EPVVGTINTPTPFSTQLPIITQNDDWEIQEQDFDDVTMVLVPPGSFEMGSKPNEVNIAVAECSGSHVNNHICPESFFTDETPTSIQEFKQAFWIDRTEITRSQYQLCVNSGWCDPIPTSIFSQEPSQPINRVTWFQANTYCEWRNSRLPTESEWEYAARGSDTLIFPWGNTFNGKFANHCDLNCGSAAWSSSYEYVHEENNDNFAVTSPVGSYPDGASWVGALDMSGNVREWTSSPYLLYPYDLQYEQGGNNGELSKNYVLRGGSFGNTSFQLRASYRRAESPTNGFNNFGIRCARDYEQ
ncbi:MAG: formylglycine-generating enzyme family protein, partial [Aggregatilineales bacterium]